MFKIEGKTISLTRGDACTFQVGASSYGNPYTLQKGDVVRFKVFKNKDCGCVEIQKDTTIEEEATTITINLTKEDTTIGEIINKPTKYWYEVELNPETRPQTIIGYDEEGAKEFILYPEGGERE